MDSILSRDDGDGHFKPIAEIKMPDDARLYDDYCDTNTEMEIKVGAPMRIEYADGSRKVVKVSSVETFTEGFRRIYFR